MSTNEPTTATAATAAQIELDLQEALAQRQRAAQLFAADVEGEALEADELDEAD